MDYTATGMALFRVGFFIHVFCCRSYLRDSDHSANHTPLDKRPTCNGPISFCGWPSGFPCFWLAFGSRRSIHFVCKHHGSGLRHVLSRLVSKMGRTNTCLNLLPEPSRTHDKSQSSNARRDPAGDALATKLLAYLVHQDDEGRAYRSRRRSAQA